MIELGDKGAGGGLGRSERLVSAAARVAAAIEALSLIGNAFFIGVNGSRTPGGLPTFLDMPTNYCCIQWLDFIAEVTSAQQFVVSLGTLSTSGGTPRLLCCTGQSWAPNSFLASQVPIA